MSFIGDVSGLGQAIGGMSSVIKDLIGLFPNAEQRAAAANKLQDVELAIATQQSATNTAEAANPNLFVSGWRPFIGWCCGAGFAYAVLIQPTLEAVAHAFGFAGPPMPDNALLSQTLWGMLGLGGLRTIEKVTGTATTTIVGRAVKKVLGR